MIILVSGCSFREKPNNSNEILKAKLKYEKAVKTDAPDKNYITLAKQLMEKGYYDVALVQLNTALKEKKNISAELFYLIGVCYREQEEYKQAIKFFNLAIDQDNEFSFAYNGLGLAYALTGQPDLARDHFIKAISLNPARADFFNNAGHLEMMEKQYAKAEEYLNKSLLINNRFEQAINNLAICRGLLGKESEALNLLMRSSPPSRAYYNMGIIYHMKGENEKAEDFFQKAKIAGSSTGKVENISMPTSPSPDENQADSTFIQKEIEEEIKREKPKTSSKVSEAASDKIETSSEKDASIVPDTIQWVPTDVDDWKIVDEGNTDGPSAWYISGDLLKQSSNIYGGENKGSVPDKPGTYAIAGNMEWTDYSLEVNMLSRDDDALGVIFRYVDENNYYRFSMDSSRNYRRLIKKSRGSISILAENRKSYLKGQKYRVKVVTLGERIFIMLDDKTLFDVYDRDIAKGKVGVYSWGNKGSEFSYPVVKLGP